MPSDIWVWFVAVIGAVLTLLGIVDKTIALRRIASEPQVVLDNKIRGLEERFSDMEARINSDRERLDSIEKESKAVNTIVIKSLQALTEHALDGNNNEQLKTCAREMNDYLLNK